MGLSMVLCHSMNGRLSGGDTEELHSEVVGMFKFLAHTKLCSLASLAPACTLPNSHLVKVSLPNISKSCSIFRLNQSISKLF